MTAGVLLCARVNVPTVSRRSSVPAANAPKRRFHSRVIIVITVDTCTPKTSDDRALTDLACYYDLRVYLRANLLPAKSHNS